MGDKIVQKTKENFNFKIALLGDPCVGKTSIAVRLTQSSFEKSSKQTIGVDFFVKELLLPEDVRITLQIWDIGGHSLGTKMLANYVYGSSAILLVYDVTIAEDKLPYSAVIANKSDLREQRAVAAEDHNSFVKENGLYSYSMSAKTGSRVVATFHRIAADLAGLQINNRHLRSVAGVLQVAVEKDEAPSLSGSHVCSDSVETEPVAKVPDNQESDAQDALLQGPCCLNVTRMGKFTARTLCIFAQKLRKLYNRPKSWWLRRQAYK